MAAVVVVVVVMVEVIGSDKIDNDEKLKVVDTATDVGVVLKVVLTATDVAGVLTTIGKQLPSMVDRAPMQGTPQVVEDPEELQK